MDAVFYMVLQFAGAVTGVLVARGALEQYIAHPSVNYVVTHPGQYGEYWAFAAELVITFILISVILWVSHTRSMNRYTGLFAGALIIIFISVEAPISGMTMNPARTFGSAFSAHLWTSIWIYIVTNQAFVTQFSYTAVPEQASLYLVLIGIGVLVLCGLRSRKSEHVELDSHS